MSHADYILIIFSPAMFGEGASANIRIISKDEVDAVIGRFNPCCRDRPKP